MLSGCWQHARCICAVHAASINSLLRKDFLTASLRIDIETARVTISSMPLRKSPTKKGAGPWATPEQIEKNLSARRREFFKFLIWLSNADGNGFDHPEIPIALELMIPRIAERLLFSGGLMECYLKPGVSISAGLTDAVKELVAQMKLEPAEVINLINNVAGVLSAMADGYPFALPEKLPPGACVVFDPRTQREGEKLGIPEHVSWALANSWKGLILGVPATAPFAHKVATVMFVIMRELSAADGVLVRRCARPSCRNIFLAARPKQKFCSHPCAAAVAVRKHRVKKRRLKKRRAKQNRIGKP